MKWTYLSLTSRHQLATEILTEFVYVLARIAIGDKQMFLQLVSATANALQAKESELWEAILDQWWTRVRTLICPCTIRLMHYS